MATESENTSYQFHLS